MTGSWVLKAPSLIVISIFVFPSFPAISRFLCGLGLRSTRVPIDTGTQ